MRWDLTIFAPDNITPLLGALNAQGEVAVSTFSTARSHPRPHLRRPTVESGSSVDFAKGTAKIGGVSFHINDVPTDPNDQRSGVFTRLLSEQRGGNGLRCRLTCTEDAGVQYVVIDGPLADPKLHASLSAYDCSIMDENWRASKIRAFDRTGTTSVFPRGPLVNYGVLPSGAPFVPAVSPGHGRYRLSSGYGYIDVDHAYRDVLTPAMKGATEPVWDDTAKGYILDKVEVWWRREGTADAWKKVARMAVPVINLPGAGTYKRRLFSTEETTVQVPDGDGGTKRVGARRVKRVGLLSAGGVAVPADDERVEFLVVYTGPASKDYPLLFSGDSGEFLEKSVRGDYSREPVPTRYHEPTVRSFRTPCFGAITEPTEDLGGWLAKNWYQPQAAAPTLDNEGRLAPTRHVLPPPGAVLTVIDNSVCAKSSDWSHPDGNAVNRVEFVYWRDVLLGKDRDPLGEDSRGDGVASTTQTVVTREPDAAQPSQARLGPRNVTMQTVLFRSQTLSRGGVAAGDLTAETGVLLGRERGKEAMDRFLYGAATFSAPCTRTAAVAALRLGDWVELRVTWLPDYLTSVRGSARVAQVVGIKDLDPVTRVLQLLDGGDALAPLPAPTLGAATADAEGVVSVPVTSLPAGASEALVEYAVTAAGVLGAPAVGWLPAGRETPGKSVATPPLPAASRVWYRGYSTAPGRRQSAPTAAASIVLPSIARILEAQAVVDEQGNVTATWKPNGFAAGVRLHFAAHAPGEVPAVLGSTLDVSAAQGVAIMPTVAAPGQEVTIDAQAWTGWTGAAVSGVAGESFRTTGAAGGLVTTTPTLREDTASIRAVTLTASVETATVWYRVNGAAWQSAAGSVSFRVDTATGDVLVEFYATHGAFTEEVHQLTIDANPDPEIRSISVTHNPTSHISVALGLDDDVVLWKAWAKKGGGKPVLANGEPDDNYLKAQRDRLDGTVRWYATDGTWEVLVRAYGSKGQYVQKEATVNVAGAAPVVGALSGVSVDQSLLNGLPRNRVFWTNNATADNGAHRVVIIESGTEVVGLAAARDARTDASGNTPGTALFGAYSHMVPWVAAGTAGAVPKTWQYEVRLYNGETFVAQYTTSISGYVDGGGSGGGGTPAPPTVTPGTPSAEPGNVAGNTQQLVATWSNTDTSLAIEVEWFSGSTRQTSTLHGAGTTTAARSYPVPTSGARCRLRYTNAAGAGAWSAFSPTVKLIGMV